MDPFKADDQNAKKMESANGVFTRVIVTKLVRPTIRGIRLTIQTDIQNVIHIVICNNLNP